MRDLSFFVTSSDATFPVRSAAIMGVFVSYAKPNNTYFLSRNAGKGATYLKGYIFGRIYPHLLPAEYFIVFLLLYWESSQELGKVRTCTLFEIDISPN